MKLPSKKTISSPSGPIRRKELRLSPEGLVKQSPLQPGQPLPLVLQPATKGVRLTAWAAGHRPYLETRLSRHGAILFRGFEVGSATDFEQLILTISGQSLTYHDAATPRHQVSGNIYTSTEYPADQRIELHNESAYALIWPLKIFFFCLTPAQQGGETPLADARKVFQRIDPQIRERFIREQVMYVRNFGDGLGLSWQTVFGTEERHQVEAYCHRAGIECEWRDGNRLRTRQVRPAVATHPRTGERVWFNQATAFHISTVEPAIRQALLAEIPEDSVPKNAYYGTGSAMESSVLDALRQAYRQEMVTFPWQAGDVLMLDNMLVAHGRAPYVGPRKILVGMAEPFSWEDLRP